MKTENAGKASNCSRLEFGESSVRVMLDGEQALKSIPSNALW
ncbi:hypothetical protein CP8484711_1400 [Chlamydia psittaci 84-8471/1]|nr:hypothetical protein CP8484711_1400 [Chlamydia psittaci 84-8471/1]